MRNKTKRAKKTKRSAQIKNKKDLTYSAKLTGVLKEFQNMVNSRDLGWHMGLSQKEVRFIYTCVMKANEIKSYQLTHEQSRWGIIIINKQKEAQRQMPF